MTKPKPPMKLYVEGMEGAERVEILLSLTEISSPEIIRAVTKHLVFGWDLPLIQRTYGTDPSNVRRALNAVNTVIAKHNRLKELP